MNTQCESEGEDYTEENDKVVREMREDLTKLKKRYDDVKNNIPNGSWLVFVGDVFFKVCDSEIKANETGEKECERLGKPFPYIAHHSDYDPLDYLITTYTY